jgi:hypothetical protein
MMRRASSTKPGDLSLPCSCIFRKKPLHFDQDPRSYVSMYVPLSTLTSWHGNCTYIPNNESWMWTMGYFWKAEPKFIVVVKILLVACDKFPWLLCSLWFLWNRGGSWNGGMNSGNWMLVLWLITEMEQRLSVQLCLTWNYVWLLGAVAGRSTLIASEKSESFAGRQSC